MIQPFTPSRVTINEKARIRMDEDLELITRTAAGEREAFNDLVIKYQKPIYSLLYRMVSNHEDAADLLQKTFIKAFTGLAAFEQRSSFKTWLYQIAINLAKNVYRDRSRFEQVNIDDVVIRRIRERSRH